MTDNQNIYRRIEPVSCCAPDEADHETDCAVCGKPLHYFSSEMMLECFRCHQLKPANAICEDGHFICDECHAGSGNAVLDLLLNTSEKDPVSLFLQAVRLEGVHMHGPEHHSIVPCVLLAAYRNNGGMIDLSAGLKEAWKRGQKMAGGACGYLGVCGAAAGAGIFASIVSGSTPLTAEQWTIPQRLTAECLLKITETGGPRCCKRTGRIALECAAQFSGKEFGIAMPVSHPGCSFSKMNSECLHRRCPFFAGRAE